MFESEHFKKQAGLLAFTPSVSEWVEQTNAIGILVKKGRYGGTYATINERTVLSNLETHNAQMI